MNDVRSRSRGNGEREQITVSLPPALVERLREFCRDKSVSADRVVERALDDYFREGDMSH